MRAELAHLAHHCCAIDKYRVETCCVIGASRRAGERETFLFERERTRDFSLGVRENARLFSLSAREREILPSPLLYLRFCTARVHEEAVAGCTLVNLASV